MTKVALIGYGKMGRMILEASSRFDVEVVSIIDPAQDGCEKEISNITLKDAQVCIDFSHPLVVLENIINVCKCKRNLVVGTTGWDQHMEVVRQHVENNEVGMIYGSNLSVGMNIFYEIAAKAAQVFAPYTEYDPYGFELHHRQKADSPSGTAKELSKIIISEIDRKTTPQYDRLSVKILPEELHFASIRAGFIPGTHTIGFDSEADTIELTHRVRNRSGFALGALRAAIWIAQRKGLFEFRDFIRDQI